MYEPQLHSNMKKQKPASRTENARLLSSLVRLGLRTPSGARTPRALLQSRRVTRMDFVVPQQARKYNNVRMHYVVPSLFHALRRYR